MTMSTHVAVGATIGLAIQNPLLGFSLGFLSHFLLDIIPHGDSKLAEEHFTRGKKKVGSYAYVALDNAIAVYLLLAFVNIAPTGTISQLSIGVAGSVLPDVLVGVYEASRRKWFKQFFNLHARIHNYFANRIGDIPLVAGIAYQVAFIAFLFTAR